ncbi:outer membrane protein transport protein [Salipiger sp. 1_MG-2023]|uniref:OmpP1/FadL family transporter n=1 Tax=Salipiger sp. 1_MG-2023 TaxID=3062665 RepID=UPI0026E3BCFE|nr:outer membrane protein transport protein [Salipiger sp. 1_MG-2023]MDO6585933.1 outer membrane protein transport protein [Salipiger sp. 1_MG-2023]
MQTSLKGAVVVALSTGAVQAGGIERTPQSPLLLYETGNVLEVSLAYASPQLTGKNQSPPFPAQDFDNAGRDFYLPSFALKYDLTETWALGVIYERPFGADVAYGDENVVLGGTTAQASTHALTTLLKYRINDNFSAFGGIRLQQASGRIHLEGLAYGAVSGYTVDLDKATGTGYVAGVAYEIPDIALRVVLTYSSAITHDMKTRESGPAIPVDVTGDGVPDVSLPLLDGSGSTEVKTPTSWTLDFQTGIMADTLLFGSVRYLKHREFRVDPDSFVLVTGDGLIDLDDTTAYTLGIGRRFNDRISGAISATFEAPTDILVSPLAPTSGYTQLRLAGAYKASEQVTLSGAVSHFWLGDGKPQTAQTARANFSDNHAWGIGLKVSYHF